MRDHIISRTSVYLGICDLNFHFSLILYGNVSHAMAVVMFSVDLHVLSNFIYLIN